MRYYTLKMTQEQDLLLAKHIGELKHMYLVLYESYKKDNNEEMMNLYKSYLDELEEIIDLLFTMFKKENIVEE